MALININNNEVKPVQTLSVFDTNSVANISDKAVLYAKKLQVYGVPESGRIEVINQLSNLYNITQDNWWVVFIPFYGALRNHFLKQGIKQNNVDLHCCLIFATLRIKYSNGDDLVAAIAGNSITSIINAPVNNTGLPYKSYVARLTQSGTNAPVAKVLYNNFVAPVVINYIQEGVYHITGAFTENKTDFFITNDAFNANLNLINQNVANGVCTINTFIGTVATNNILFKTRIEIRVDN